MSRKRAARASGSEDDTQRSPASAGDLWVMEYQYQAKEAALLTCVFGFSGTPSG